MSELAQLEEERLHPPPQFDIVAGQLRDDPGNTELQALQDELNNFITLLDENIAELKPKQAPAPKKQTTAPPPQPEKWSRENHPAFQNSAPPKEVEPATVAYRVNENVMAQWKHGDGRYYPARITSITGSSADPVYIVKFTGYDETENLSAADIRPHSNKRKADAPPPPPTASVAPHAPGVVSSAGATMYPEAKKEADKKNDLPKPPKAKKIKANKELEAGKSKWQDFNAKSKFGKSQKKDSMFRTPEGIHGRVGFTGSGQAMRKDPTRSRHIYQVADEE
ncbi:hypothetical protein B0I35DRAFT_478008 [Stachybotrys elegans]|uniref:Tudor domain-containing protein n=1 Tax=Stachybotrys elegans TaxID=80388 RepID=A0A8K0SXB9_9HYPO|nr:hypothetical protein B0I35DRAFT_478008 [Stachybotrys elegans]